MDRIINDDFFNLKEYDLSNIKMVLTSPPYFDARNYGGESLYDKSNKWITWCYKALELLSRNIREDGVIWWNTGSGYRDFHKMGEIYQLVWVCETTGIYLIDEIPWIKTSSPPKNIKNRPYPAWEHNFIFARHPEKVKFYRDNVRRPYSKATLNRLKYSVGKLSSDLDGEYGDERKMVKPNPLGATPPNYLILPQDYSKRPHPAPMSPDLANWAIRAYTEEGDTVLDPMMGIGTTWVECEKLNRQFVGFELYQEYIDIAMLSIHRLKNGEDPYNGLKKAWREINEKSKTDN